jgi:glycosyltransferase involved in cell wall biosynthesis
MTLSVRNLVAESGVPRRPIRVAQIITKLSAGAGSITLHGALALDSSRFAVTILAPEGGTLSSRAEAAGVAMLPLRHMAPDLDVRSDWLGLRELVQVLGSAGYDVVHTHSAKAGALGRVAAHRVRVPAIVHSFHGFPFHDFQSFARRRAYIAIERRLARLTNQFVTDGTWTAAEAVRLGIAPPDRVRAICSPIDVDVPSVTPATRDRARRLMRLPPEAQVVGTIARLDPQKAPQILVRALAALTRSNVYAVWVGGGSLLPEVRTLVRRLHLEDRFRLMGERADVADLLPGFDVFAMPSLYEGLPCAVVEAIACGVPVVATAVNSVPEVVVPGRTGILVRPNDAASLAGAIDYLLSHPEEAARMARRAAASLGQRFRPETLGRDLTEVYDLALGARTRVAMEGNGSTPDLTLAARGGS